MLAFLTACLLSCSMLETGFDTPADESDDTRVVFEVPTGATARSIGPRLVDGGFVSNGVEWRLSVQANPSSQIRHPSATLLPPVPRQLVS